MVIKGLRTYGIDFSDGTLDLGTAVEHIDPGSAVISQNMDYSNERKGLSGRYGTKAINIKADGTPDPLAVYPIIDIYRAQDEDTGFKYILWVYDNGTNYKLAYLRTDSLPTPPWGTTINKTDASAFTLTRGSRLTFVTARDPADGDVKVFCNNGVNNPFTWNFATNGIENYKFGTAEYKLAFLMPFVWKASLWASGRVGEQTMRWWSDVDDFRKWVDQGANSGFLAAPASTANDYSRGAVVLNDRLILFNTDSIGEFVDTGNTAAPFLYRQLLNDNGAVHPKAIIARGDKAIHIDKREPYLKAFNGASPITLDPNGTIEKSFQKWVDYSDLANIRMAMRDSTLLIDLQVGPTNTATGTDNKRWIAAIDLERRDSSNRLLLPLSMWNIRAADIVTADEGTDFGQVYFADAEPTDIGGTDYYFIKRLYGWYDARGGGAAYGDGNGDGLTATAVQNIYRTGWLKLNSDEWKQYKFFKLYAGWEGTVSQNAQLNIKYRCPGWTGFENLYVNAVSDVNPNHQYVPFPLEAQGHMIQLEFRYSDTTSRPIIYACQIQCVDKPGVKR